ncbi:hypothetical protein AmDm5_1735 [Acetobacter malorum]|nr:hypothetical protein AmDm5_1735 [Acetobacter malorum]
MHRKLHNFRLIVAIPMPLHMGYEQNDKPSPELLQEHQAAVAA